VELEKQKVENQKRDMIMSFVITIDGPAASGKSSVSRELAKRLQCDWVSTGSFYRGLAFVAQQTQTNLNSEADIAKLAQSNVWKVEIKPEKTHVIFNGKDVTDEAHQESVGLVASKISQYPAVRKMLLGAQRDCKTSKGLVAEGRDCGSVVFPNAELKIYLDADSENRAQRRAQQSGLSKEDTEKQQKVRDNQDLTRRVAPLMAPDGSHVIDTSTMTLHEVVDYIESLAKTVLSNASKSV
jgi:cytidylate kinase